MFDNQRRFPEVLGYSEKALNVLEFNAAILMIRANVYGKLHKYRRAEELYLLILEREPNNYMSHTNLAILYHRWNKLEKAIQHYSKAVQLHPAAGREESTANKNLNKLLKRQQLSKMSTK